MLYLSLMTHRFLVSLGKYGNTASYRDAFPCESGELPEGNCGLQELSGEKV